MKRLYKWLLSRKRWLVLMLCSAPLALWAGWALSHRTVAMIVCVIIWFAHLGLGVVAVMAGIRVWRSRHIPFFNYLWLYLNAFVIDVLSAIVLLFVARGVKFTWKFTAVMFISTLLMDVVRVPLLFSIIRGPTEGATAEPKGVETSGALPPDFWRKEFREAVREELEPIKARLEEVERKINGRRLDH